MAVFQHQEERTSPPWPAFSKQDVETVVNTFRNEFDEEFITAAFVVVSPVNDGGGKDRVQEVIDSIKTGLDRKQIMDRYTLAVEEHQKKLQEYEQQIKATNVGKELNEAFLPFNLGLTGVQSGEYFDNEVAPNLGYLVDNALPQENTPSPRSYPQDLEPKLQWVT